MTFLLDTNVVREWGRGERADPGVRDWLQQVSLERIRLSAIVDHELEVWALSLARRDPRQGGTRLAWLDTLRDRLERCILPVTAEIAREAARHSIPNRRPLPDLLIAATAIHHDLTLVTRNVRDFDIPGLRVLNPFSEEKGTS